METQGPAEPSIGLASASDCSRPRLDADMWKVIDGRLLRRNRKLPHTSSVSARTDAQGHSILPKLSLCETISTSNNGSWTHVDSEQHNRGVDILSIETSALTLSHGVIAPDVRCVRTAWTAGQLQLMGSCRTRLSDARRPGQKGTACSNINVHDRQAFLCPSNRSEAIQLAQNLDDKLHQNHGNFLATLRSWQMAFCEMVRQVKPPRR